MDCQKLVNRVGIVDKKHLKKAMKGLMCSIPEHCERYDRLFDLYWLQNKGRGPSKATTGGINDTRKKHAYRFSQQERRISGGHFDVPDASASTDDETSDGRLSKDGASTKEAIEQTNFKQ